MSYLWHPLLCDSNPLSRELTKVAEPFVKQEDEGKFRCKTCQKLFKATFFVEKHATNLLPSEHLPDICNRVRHTYCEPDMGPDVHHASQLSCSLATGSEVRPAALFSVSLLTLPSHSLHAFLTPALPALLSRGPSFVLSCPSLSLRTPFAFYSCLHFPVLHVSPSSPLTSPPCPPRSIPLDFSPFPPTVLTPCLLHTCLTVLYHPPCIYPTLCILVPWL